ncbi:MAG: response regulator [Candidatus Marinimicrobia bacterium]|nr:response regulator [Candidatus Neomarinimicrobiota bacterium]
MQRNRLLLLALMLFPALSAFGQESEPIHVGIYEFEPLMTTQDNLYSRGIFIDLLEYIAAEEDWQLEYHEGTFQELVNKLHQNQIDLLPGASYTGDNSDSLVYTNETIISTWAQTYTPSRNYVQSILDLDNLTVGVVRDDPYNVELRSIISRFDLECTFIEFNHYRDVFSALEMDWIDVGVIDRLYAVIHEDEYGVQKNPIFFSPVELRFAIPAEGRLDLIEIIDYHLSALKKNSNSVYYQFVNQTFGTASSSKFLKYLPYILSGTLILLLISFGTTVFMRKMVQQKTAELSEKNETLEKEINMRIEAEEAVVRSNQLLHKTFESIKDGLLITDSDINSIYTFNRAAAEIFGYSSDKIGQIQLSRFFTSQKEAQKYYHEIREMIIEKGYFSGEVRLRRKNGELFPAEVAVNPIEDSAEQYATYVIIIRDVTYRVQSRQARKMEAIGTLAGGIAHDFNNLLTPIIGYSDLMLLSKSTLEEKHSEFVEAIGQAAHQAKSLVNQILTFSRKSEQEKQPIHLGTVVQSTLSLLRSSIPSTIELNFRIDTHDDVVMADPTQIHQIVMNLCTNSVHALPESNGKIQLHLFDHDASTFVGWSSDRLNEDLDYVCLAVKDNGSGIPVDILEKIFDPFYTTKEKGKGTGMGLAVVQGIVNSYQGAITVESEPYEGAAFYLYLPKSQKSVRGKTTRNESMDYSGRSEHILLVDDEKMVADMFEHTLISLGYTITKMTNSQEALSLFESDPGSFDLILTDQTMPALTGAELARKALSVRPELPIILLTGYSETFSIEDAREIGIREYLMKPIIPGDLARAIRLVLDEKDLSKMRWKTRTISPH